MTKKVAIKEMLIGHKIFHEDYGVEHIFDFQMDNMRRLIWDSEDDGFQIALGLDYYKENRSNWRSAMDKYLWLIIHESIQIRSSNERYKIMCKPHLLEESIKKQLHDFKDLDQYVYLEVSATRSLVFLSFSNNTIFDTKIVHSEIVPNSPEEIFNFIKDKFS